MTREEWIAEVGKWNKEMTRIDFARKCARVIATLAEDRDKARDRVSELEAEKLDAKYEAMERE